MSTEHVLKKSRFNGRVASRLLLGAVVALIISVVFFRGFWTSLPRMLAPDYLLDYNVAPWGVLLLCAVFLVVKRRDIDLAGNMPKSVVSPAGVVGLGLIVFAILLPAIEEFLVFRVLTAWVGVFIVFFGRAGRIPAILLAIFGFAVAFPYAVEKFIVQPAITSTLVPLVNLINIVGLPVANNGAVLSFTTAGGEPASVVITAACSGATTMAVFIAIFALMMLDRRLPPGKAVKVFLFGMAGTWFQNILRIMILVVFGLYLGESAMWKAHYWTIYVLFPLWYLLFAFVYFQHLKPGDKNGRIYSRQPGG